MKKTIYLLLTVAFLVGCQKSDVMIQGDTLKKKEMCTTIQDGILTYSAGHYLEGEPLVTGFDIYGYNYQAHMFSGSYANVYLGRDGFPPYTGDDAAYLADNPGAETKWYWPYRDVNLIMKWNDAWLANEDCNEDGSLDRHYGFDTYIGSGAWETNHQWGTYEVDGEICEWDYFVKIVAAPANADLIDGVWYNADGTEIGPEIWDEFAIIQEVENDPCGDIEGLQYISPDHAGLGGWH